MKTFLNSRENLITHVMDATIAAANGAVGRFSIDSTAKVVARRAFDGSKVAIISGGGSGHEPAHAGFVGEGMLTAAVCGEIFASPSIDAVFSAILAVTGPAGCLLVVKNYTGDRLNFGAAAEKAKALGLRVEMVIVSDDIAIPGAPQPRGVAGTLFIHKLAGFMSERGDSLADIFSAVTAAARRLFTISAARDSCTIPGNEKIVRLQDNQVEIGLGIHGEPGFEVAPFTSPGDLVALLAGRLEQAIPNDDARYALMFNNLGGLSVIEALALFAAVTETDLAKRVDFFVGPASLMTALDMPGFSLTMFALDPLSSAAIKAPVGPQFWPGVSENRKIPFIETPEIAAVDQAAASANPQLRRLITVIANTCIENEKIVNDLDAKVGDGDTGSTFAGAARVVLQNLDRLPLAEGGKLLLALSRLTSQSVGGTSGVLFSIMFAGAADEFSRSRVFAPALSHGLQLVQKYGGAQPGDRTMVDALKPAFDVYEKGGSIADMARAARQGADHTATMSKAKAGRSSYLNEASLQGVMDPGAAAIAYIFEALAAQS